MAKKKTPKNINPTNTNPGATNPAGATSTNTTAAAGKNTDRKAVLAKLKAEEKRKKRRSLIIQIAAGVAIVALVLTGVVYALIDSNSNNTAAATPTKITKDGAVKFGETDAKVTIQVVEDFQCPACRQFEETTKDLFDKYLKDPDISVEYRPIAFLDNQSSTRYSTRALNASMCVLENTDKDTWFKYAKILYTNQPAEGGAGLTNDTLIDLAKDAGANSDKIEDCVNDAPYEGWAAQTTQKTFETGVTGTPAVFVNGEQLASTDPATIEQAVTEASK